MFNRSKRNLKNKKGFTLIELVVVIAVIGILAAIAIPRVTGITSSAKEKATKDHLAILNSAVERYLAEGTDTTNIKFDKANNNNTHIKGLTETTGQTNNKDNDSTEANAETVIGFLQSGNYLSQDVSEDTLPNGNKLYFDYSDNQFEDSGVKQTTTN